MSSAAEQGPLEPSEMRRPVGSHLAGAFSSDSLVAQARNVLATEAAALEQVRRRLDDSFARAAALVFDVSSRGGSVIVTGMGKAGLVGQQIDATLASTGCRAHS